MEYNIQDIVLHKIAPVMGKLNLKYYAIGNAVISLYSVIYGSYVIFTISLVPLILMGIILRLRRKALAREFIEHQHLQHRRKIKIEKWKKEAEERLEEKLKAEREEREEKERAERHKREFKQKEEKRKREFEKKRKKFEAERKERERLAALRKEQEEWEARQKEEEEKLLQEIKDLNKL